MATNCHWLFVLHELPLMYHELSLIVLGYCIRVGWFQQPCHAVADRCGGGHLWLRLSCSFSLMRSNRRIKADIIGPNAQSGRFPAMSAGPAHPTRLRFGVPKLSERSNHVMPAWTSAMAGIYGCCT